MPPTLLVHDARLALVIAVVVSVPVLAIAALVGLVVAAFQAASQIQDPTLSHLPRLLVVAAALTVLGPWMGHHVASFAREMFLASQTIPMSTSH